MKKRIKEISDKFMKVYKSKTLKEMVINIPWGFPEFLIFASMFMFMLLPVYQLVSNTLSVDFLGSVYWMNVSGMNQLAAVWGIISLFLIAAKQMAEKRNLKNFINKPACFFGFTVIMMVVSTAVNGFNFYALHGDIYRNESLFTFIYYFVIYFYCSSMIGSRKLKALLLYSYMISCTVIAAVSLLHVFRPVEAFSGGNGFAAVFHQFNHYGYYLMLGILISAGLFIQEKKLILKIICLVSFVLNIVILIINDTFGCYLACFAALIFAVIVISVCEKKLNRLSVLAFIIFILVSLIMSIWYDTVFSNIIDFITDIFKVAESDKSAVDQSGNIIVSPEVASTGSGRWTLWLHTLKYIKERPLLGFGVEGIMVRLYKETYGVNNRPHCEFLQYAVFFGVPAAVSYICGVLAVYFNGLKRRYDLDIYTVTALISAFAYLVSSTFGNTMYYTAPYFFILLGLGFSQKRKGIKKS